MGALVGTLFAKWLSAMQGSKANSETHSYDTGQLAFRFGVSLALLMGLTLAASHWFKPELEELSRQFYDRFGGWGAALGTWLADGFTFPVPPQAYMLLAEAHGATWKVFPWIVAGSLAGGVSGYVVAPLLTRIAWVAAAIERTEPKVKAFLGKSWVLSGVLLGISPIAFSWLCYSSALYRLPRRVFALLCVLRVPKLLVYQLLVSWGWS